MSGGDVYDIHIQRCATVASQCSITGDTDIQKDIYAKHDNEIQGGNNMRRILTIKEAAKLIDGLTEYRIRQMCKSGQLPCFMAGKKYLIDEQTLYKAVFGEIPKDDNKIA